MSDTRPLRAIAAPSGDDVLTTLLPALAAALDGSGPAVLPLPTGAVRRVLMEELRPDLPLEDREVALVVPSSGSTGMPKGVLLSAAALLHSARAVHDRLGGPGQWLLALPVTHIGGLSVLVRSLAAQARPEVLDLYGGFDIGAFARATSLLSPSHRRYTALVPTQLHRLLDAEVDLSPYDAIVVGGAAAPPTLLARAAGADARVVVSYGMSETCGGCVYDGRPLDGVDVDLDESGRIGISGPVVFSGYRLRPDLTAAALVHGRHRAADYGRWTDDGRMEVIGRADDVIVSGGLNVSTGHVEAVLSDHPGVRLSVVVPRSDDEWGERVVAVIQPIDRQDAPTLDDIRSFAADRLEPAALPRELVVLGSLPMLAPGKPDRLGIRALVAGRPALT